MTIGIGGISRSGKTTLAFKLKKYFGDKRVNIIHLDEYTIPWTRIPRIRNMVDWEHPSSINFLKLEMDIKESINQFEITISEGFLIYYHEPIRSLFDTRIYLSIDKMLFSDRRKLQHEEPDWYIEHIWESYLEYHGGFKDLCDIRLDENSNIEMVIEEYWKNNNCCY